ncbi:MAG: hypothetical protein V2I56_07440 [Desulfobacteraceae bacterium]|jgi:HD superfamily phosphodiesterase|nr:hypothetical protein [Desulfobacteraceae bacterium]
MPDTVKEMAHKHFKGARGSHHWGHTLRVCRLGDHPGSVEGADLDLLRVAACLDDIGRGSQDESKTVLFAMPKKAPACKPGKV